LALPATLHERDASNLVWHCTACHRGENVPPEGLPSEKSRTDEHRCGKASGYYLLDSGRQGAEVRIVPGQDGTRTRRGALKRVRQVVKRDDVVSLE
jgi:hypothetical protein